MLYRTLFKSFFFAIILFFSTGFAFGAVTPLNNFDAKKYLGTWYEIARIPFHFEKGCVAPITANYTTDADNPAVIVVTNTCHQADGSSKSAQGKAYFVDDPSIAKLEVTFLPQWLHWVPFTYGDYWVLYTDYTGYALVGSPNHAYLWILARSEKTNQKAIKHLLAIATEQGFDIQQLTFNYPIH
jgi:apolipoprotein D and lipocalin family protein